MRSWTLLLASTVSIMAGATIAPALPRISEHFSGEPHSDVLVKLVLTITALFAGIGAPLAGAIIDRFGRKRLLIGALIVYVMAGVSGGLTDSLPALLATRAVVGLMVGAVLTTVAALIGDYYEGSARQRFMGIQAAVMGYGGMVFLMAGGMLADRSWRAPFVVFLLAAPAIPMAIRSIVDVSTSALRRGEDGDAAEAFPTAFTVGLSSICFLTMVAFFAIPVYLPFYLVELSEASSTQAGMALATMTLVSSSFSLGYRRIRRRLGRAGVFAWILACMAAGFFLLWQASSYPMAVGACAVMGAGIGLIMPHVNVWANERAPVLYRGRVLGVVGLSFFVGQFVSPIVLEPAVVDLGLAGTYGLLSGVSALGAIIAAGAERRAR